MGLWENCVQTFDAGLQASGLRVVRSQRSIATGITTTKMNTIESPPSLKFITLGNKQTNISTDGSDSSSNLGFKFRVISYNILAQVYVKSSNFPHSPPSCLKWKTRSNAVSEVLKSFNADFLCLQELDKFDEFYKDKIMNYGYSCIYVKRSRQKLDGCGIFYNQRRAELISKVEIEYNDLVDILSSGSASDKNENTDELTNDLPKHWPYSWRNSSDAAVRLERDCVGLFAAFTLNCPSQNIIILANTHIYWDPKWADVKLAQVEYLLIRLARYREEISKKYNCNPSIILAGDFNSLPGDMVYKHLTSSEKENELDLNLCSLYASLGGEPAFTNYTPDFTGTLDYIFISKNSELKPVSLLEIPGPDSPKLDGGLPNTNYPSDHLPIGADFEVCTSSKPL
ncbi:Glucose-repressible alcohol dehydrogenase transcriptional effector [Zostera marina]|uniref:Glucose-repressible alcohol dehydrogenase transcriptional effector n=1 Tax=Zostera marina TaxID=29655 RepID=A0A0K9NLL5_ZOSMR|nr:Glucose-repressible alcohol dehydrogenase transcriptional effector [Zostera marina]